MGYVSPLETQEYHQGYQVPWDGYEVYNGSPNWYLYPYQYQNQERQDHGNTVQASSPYDDSQGHGYQAPYVQVPVHQPQEAPQDGQQHLTRAGGRPDTGTGEVSPLSSTGSGPPYPRVSVMSGPG